MDDIAIGHFAPWMCHSLDISALIGNCTITDWTALIGQQNMTLVH